MLPVITDTGRRTYVGLPAADPGDRDVWLLRDAAVVLCRRYGAHWCSESRRWWIGRRARSRDQLLADLTALTAGGAAVAREHLLQQTAAGRGTWRDQPVYVLWRDPGYQGRPDAVRDDRRWRICWRDGSGGRTVEAEEVRVQRWYRRPRSLRRLAQYAEERKVDRRYAAAAAQGRVVTLVSASATRPAPWAAEQTLAHPRCKVLPLRVMHVASERIEDGLSFGLGADEGWLHTAYCTVHAPELTGEQRRRLAQIAATDPDQAVERLRAMRAGQR